MFLLVRVLFLLTVWLIESLVRQWRETRTGCITALVIVFVAAIIVEACES
jgi:hypothetical protein